MRPPPEAATGPGSDSPSETSEPTAPAHRTIPRCMHRVLGTGRRVPYRCTTRV